MAEESGHTQQSLFTSDLGSLPDEIIQKDSRRSYLIPILITLTAFYFLAFALTELITNYQQTTFTINLTCTEYKCSGQTGFVSFQQQKNIYIYLINSKISQNDISSQLQQTNNILTSCSSYNTNKQGNKIVSITGSSLNENQPMLPCGKFVSYYPGDNFRIFNNQTSEQLQIVADDLDQFNVVYSNIEDKKSWANISSERFKVWNQKQSGNGLEKLWGVINNMPSGNYKIELQSQNPLSSELVSDIKLQLSDNKALFGHNLPLCILNFAAAMIMFVIGSFSCWLQQKINKQQQKLVGLDTHDNDIRKSSDRIIQSGF